MILAATILALSSAVLHATWNLLAKTSVDRELTLVAQYAIGILFAPLLLLTGWPGSDAVPFLVASSVVHAFYAWALARAYDHGDFSFAYPVARGGGALLAALGGVLLLDDSLTVVSWLSITVAGLALMSLASTKASPTALAWAGTTALTIATYTVIDASGARTSMSGVSYAVALPLFNGIGVFGWGLARHRGPDLLAASAAQWRRWALGAVFMAGAYGLVLVAVTEAPVGYVAMLRESSVVLATFAGWRLLHEKMGSRRLVASIVMLVGLAGLVLSSS